LEDKKMETQITKEEFESFEMVKESGVTNMFDVMTVCSLSGLNRDKVVAIMKNYCVLRNTFGK